MNFTNVHPKVALAGFAGALVTVLISEFHRHGIDFDPDEAAALIVIVGAVVGWLVPSQGGSQNA